ncbi:MAG: hypothetical protein F6K47_20270 [Symploca sp. SIO2E6]|nr:hypothetical protein [Symploca sp. SIO2E6]
MGDGEMGRQGRNSQFPIPNSQFPIPKQPTTNNKQQTTNNKQQTTLITDKSVE